MAADRSTHALKMSEPVTVIEDKQEFPGLYSCNYILLPPTPTTLIFEDEVKKYYPNRESLTCPEYGYAAAHCRRKITGHWLQLLSEHCHDLKIPYLLNKFLTFASTYYSFNRNAKMLIEDTPFMCPDSTLAKRICDFLSPWEENIYRSILEGVIEITRKREAPFVKPSIGLLSRIPDAPLMTLINFAESYRQAISNAILENCPEICTQAILEKIIFDAQKKYYDVEFLAVPSSVMQDCMSNLPLEHIDKTSFLKNKLTLCDSQVFSVLEKYKDGIYVSAIPLWALSGKQIKKIVHFLSTAENSIRMSVNPLIAGSPFNTTLKNQTFLMFNGSENPIFDFDINILPPSSIKRRMYYRNLIGIGFTITEEVDLKTLKNLSIQTMSLMFDCKLPAFFYHPSLGLKHLPPTRLLEMKNEIASSSPVMDFKKKMQQYSIVWQNPKMEIYESLNPEACLFSLEKIKREDCENDANKKTHFQGNDDRISFSFSFRYLQILFSGKTKWINGIIPVLQLGSTLYLDRDHKIIQLLNKRKEFYLKELFTRHHEKFQRILSQLSFPLGCEHLIEDFSLTPNFSQNSLTLFCNFKGAKESSVTLFDIECKNNSILDPQDAYLLVRRLLHYLAVTKTHYIPDKLLIEADYPCIRMKDLALALSLYDLKKEFIVKIFEKFHGTGSDTFNLQSQMELNLFLHFYLNSCDYISPACKAQVMVFILKLLPLALDHIVRCLLWCVANDQYDELNQLPLSSITKHRSDLLRISSPSPEVTAALLVLDKITPSTLPPPPAKVESKMTAAITPSLPPLVVLPVPKPREIKIESKSEEKDELKKILWQGKEIHQETPLAVVVQYALDQYYLKPYPRQPEKLINRPLHGGTHAIMTVLLVDLFKELLKKYYPDFLIDPITQKNRLSDEEEKLIYLMALYHDSGNTSENQGAETDQTVHADNFYRDAIKMGFSIEASQKCRFLMIHKDSTNQNIEKVILHDADCLEFLRCSSKEGYDLTHLNIYLLIKNHCPGVMQEFQEDMQNIIDYYNLFLILLYKENVQKIFESKELNLREHLYTKMQEEITHYRLVRAMVPDLSPFSFFQIFSAHKKLAMHRLYASLPRVLFYSYKELDNEKIKAIYLNDPRETIPHSKTEEKMEKFEGAFLLRGLRRKYSEEATVWDGNLTILREEKISDILALRKRYDINPLQNFRFRPATLILPNVPVKSRWGDSLHILLKPSAVSFWGGFKKNVFSDYFEAKDFSFKEALPKRTLKAFPSNIIASKVKNLPTVEAMITKLQEMEAVRRGQKLSHRYRYFGCSALPANEVFLINQDSLSASIEGVGIYCDLTSSTWPVDVVSVAQEILTLTPSLPSTIRYFFYLPEKGLTPLSLAEIRLIAKGRIKSDLPYLGLVEGLNLFNACPIHLSQLMSTELESKKGDFENQKFKFKSTKSITFGHAFLHKGIPCIQVESDIFFDSAGIFRTLSKNESRLNLTVVQKLLSNFYWEMQGLHQVSDVKIELLPDREEQDKDVIRLSFKFLESSSGKDVAGALLNWMGYPVTHDKLRSSLSGKRIELTLSYPQAFAHVQQTLTQYKERSYKELCIEEKLIETFTSWNQLPEKQKHLLNFCKILAIEYQNPSREDAIFSAINDIIPSFKDIPPGFLNGIVHLFNLYALTGWTEDQCARLMAQFLFVLHAHSPLNLQRVLQVIATTTPGPLLFSLFNSRRLEEIKLMESSACVPLERLYRTIILEKGYAVESAMAFVVKYAGYFSLDQLTKMLWTFIWKKKTDIKLMGREGLFKIEKCFRGKDPASSLSLHVMHSLVCGKHRELETPSEEKPHTPLDSSMSSVPLSHSRKRKEREEKEENQSKHARAPTDSPALSS